MDREFALPFGPSSAAEVLALFGAISICLIAIFLPEINPGGETALSAAVGFTLLCIAIRVVGTKSLGSWMRFDPDCIVFGRGGKELWRVPNAEAKVDVEWIRIDNSSQEVYRVSGADGTFDIPFGTRRLEEIRLLLSELIHEDLQPLRII